MLGNKENQEQSVATAVGAGTYFEGTLNSEESVRIDGSFDGAIDCRETLIVGKNAEIEADIVTQTAVIGGTVRGDITAHERIEVRDEGEIYGDLTAPVLQVEKGVGLAGNCTINTGEDSKPAKVTSIKEELE